MGKKSGYGLGMNNPDRISEIRDPGWKKFVYGIGDKYPGSATLTKSVS
jgi:hypothetical protein